jgi:DEAD/DEAH box helicase domain-containing protein
MSGTIFNILKRSVLEHLTNVGLLPNYAFPETGVVLNAQVRNRNLTGIGDANAAPKSIELVRPAKSALRELAPENLFYTQGYKLKISGLNIISWREEALDYRFCSRCDELELDSGQQGFCPKCGDASWGSVNNKHKFVKLKAVKSFSDEVDATVDDSSEEREEKISRITQHYKFHPKSTQGAWAMIKIPFGIEYLKEVDIYEVNTGLIDNSSSRELTINESEVPVHGYITCKHCGKSSSRSVEPNRHYIWCKKKDINYNNQSDDVYEEVYLYRQLKTEAIKILLPVQEFESESMVSMFKSGIELGLKHYYKGNPQHIEIREYKELNKKTARNDRFLVLYDTIPGGTGYLAKLFDYREFSLLIEKAYKAIKECTCQYNGKDGCYRCIYTYANQFEREELSRKKAEELFSKINNSADKWDFITDGLNDVTNSGKIEESELEERFIRCIKNYVNQQNQQLLGWSFEVVTEDGVNLYKLQIKTGTTEISYIIRPQVNLGEPDGIALHTRCDHLIICTDIKFQNESINGEELSKIPSIAIYLDGYQYHASKENNRFVADVKKRLSIIKNPRFLQWTLTWDDLTRFENLISGNKTGDKSESDEFHKKVVTHINNFNKISKAPTYKNFDDSIKTRKNNLDRLLYLLENIYHHRNDLSIPHRQLIFPLQSAFLSYPISAEDAQKFIDETDFNLESVVPQKSSDAFLSINDMPTTEELEIKLLMQLNSLKALGQINLSKAQVFYEKRTWENFWNIFNLLQHLFQELQFVFPENLVFNHVKTKASDVSSILDNFPIELHLLIGQLIKTDIEFNRESSFSLEDANGAIIAEASLGFHSAKIFLDPFDEESRKAFLKAGYSEKTVDTFQIKDITSI